MPLNAFERETTISVSAGDEFVNVYTAQRKFINRLRKDDRVAIVATGEYDGSPCIAAQIPAHLWSPTSGLKRRSKPMSVDQRTTHVERSSRAVAPSERGEARWLSSRSVTRCTPWSIRSPAW